MSNFNWYKMQDACRKVNNSETVKRSDVLVCKSFGGECGLIKCADNHNIKLRFNTKPKTEHNFLEQD